MKENYCWILYGSDPYELHYIWYNYYFSDIIESEKADKEMMDNMSYDDKMAALEMFQNNEAFQAEFSNAMLKAGESCKEMFRRNYGSQR